MLTELVPLAEAGDHEAAFGVGFVRFVRAIEATAQMLYVHGLASPDPGPMIGQAAPLPIPANPDPSPLDYETLRGLIEGVVADFDTAAEALLAAGESGDYVVVIDPLRVRIDINDDGTAEDTEALAGILGAAGAMSGSPSGRPAVPPARERMGRTQPPGGTTPDAAPEAGDTTIGFDRADAIWLAGYANLVTAQADFLLAHDFSMLVNATFHRLFPRSGLPMQDYARGGSLVLDPETDTAIADAIAAVHSLNWPVVEPARLQRVLQRFKTVIALSRRNWQAILAETDDNRELVPSPTQTSILPDGVVTQEIVDAWLETLDVAEQILEGELLVPHWRFRQGFDLKAYFETATRTDFVMLLTGYDALPYLREGPVATAQSFAAANRVFGDQLLGYVFWFN